MPTQTESWYDVTSRLEVVIDRDGRVVDARMLSFEAGLAMGRAGKTDPYAEAILSAVRQWTYPPRSGACRGEVPVNIRIVDDAP